MFTKSELRVIAMVLGSLADDIHDGDPVDYDFSEQQIQALHEKAKAAWLAAE
jgi:hypothetical protein